MPGISDKRALMHAVIDSLSVPKSTAVRLAARGLRDVDAAIRLRKVEIAILRTWEPMMFSDISQEAKDCLVNKWTGNHYYYKFGQYILSLLRDKDFIMDCRLPRIVKQYQIAGKLLEVKVPAEEFHHSITSFPEGYQRIHNIYIALRSLHDYLFQMSSRCGKNRGRLQSLNTTNKNEARFQEKLLEWMKSEKKFLAKEKRRSWYSDHLVLGGRKYVEMVRISDIIYMRVFGARSTDSILLTPNHFERCTSLIRQISNVLLGTLLAYGQEGNYPAEEIIWDTVAHMKALFRLGEKDDLAVGEAGKAVTDLYKAQLSQTPELPWNNFHMLLQTYSEKRKANATNLYADFRALRHDPDIMLNISYVWKTAAQPDSSIRDDFTELVEGLSKPNPIIKEAPGMIEVAIRRAVLVGALRENRQVSLEPEDGVVIAKELYDAVSHSHPGERQLRMVTHGMLKGVKIYVPNVFPSPFDVSHLMFKDKSSSVSKMSIRKDIRERSEAEEEIMMMEDESIMDNANLAAERFLDSIVANPTKDNVNWQLKATANDILTSLDDRMSEVFKEAEQKFKWIARSLAPIRDKYGGNDFLPMLQEWARNYPDLLINTATEPKYGEVHKRSVRIFYMFEKSMKTFLSQFERIARVVGYYIKGAEIVKGDRARETHMNVLSSAHQAGKEGVLAYQILFDLSKFSQKFNHKIIDAATKVIGELVGYPEYAQISDLFKASFLFVSSRNTDKAFVGVLGAFEGFLNFLWTNIHATVMDIALRNCGRSGDLAAYSDDGLLMFTMNAKPNDPTSVVQKELTSIIDSIKNTYTDFGLDFNLGKTLISRNLAEFLGIVQYKGHRFPTWMKELCHLGIPDSIPLIRSIGQEINDVSSQMAALMKAGMPPFAASFMGYLEIFMGPGRRLLDTAAEARGTMEKLSQGGAEVKAITLFCCLNQAFGGIRVPDPFTATMTADFDPTSEMLYDIKNFLNVFPECTGVIEYLLNMVKPTDDYTSLFLGAAPVHTEGVKYSTSMVKSKIAQEVRKKLSIPQDHPLSRKSAPALHEALENTGNIYLPSITSITRYIVPSILYEKSMAPTKSSSVARLLKKFKIRSIQKFDTKTMVDQMEVLLKVVTSKSDKPLPTADELYRISFPKLSFAPSLPSSREIAAYSDKPKETSYEVHVRKKNRLDEKGSTRFLNQDYYDDLVPPLVTTDVNIQHLMNAPDLISHCMRGIYSELISSSAQGHDLSGIVGAVCLLNKCQLMFPQILTPLRDMRKIAVANRKKSIHRVFWSEAVKNAVSITRMGPLNHHMTSTSNLHYSLIVTSVLSRIQFLLTGSKLSTRKSLFYYEVSVKALENTKLTPMYYRGPTVEVVSKGDSETASLIPFAVRRAIEQEVVRTVDGTKQELVDNLLIGRMGMLPDFQKIGTYDSILDPLRYAVVWSIISRIDAAVDGRGDVTGVTQAPIRSAPLEKTPIDIVDLAVIYRAYKNVRKSDVGIVVKEYMKYEGDDLTWEDSGILDDYIADETLNAVDNMGLITSLNRHSLKSARSALTYDAMLTANNISMIYYSLDSKPETSSSDKISPARVNAMRRIVDTIISRYFREDRRKLEAELVDSLMIKRLNEHGLDNIKIALMIIRGSMRGSVHRNECFNIRIATEWLIAFVEIILDFCCTLDYSFLRPLDGEDPRFGKCEGLGQTELEILENHLRVGVYKYITYDKGSQEQYDQLIKFFLKLGEWGYLPTLFDKDSSRRMRGLLEHVYTALVKPAMMMARTVSYNTVDKAIQEQIYTPHDKTQFDRGIEHAIHILMSGYDEDISHEDLLSLPPYDLYRYRPGPLSGLNIAVFFPPEINLTFGPAMAYSLALPLLFASGHTAFKSVDVLGHSNPLYFMELFSKAFAELSLPFDDRGLPLILLQGLSESDIWYGLNSWKETNHGPVMASVEIPPAASTFSLGLISYLTSQQYSYATIGLSSDCQGISIYVVSILEGPIPRIVKRLEAENREKTSLGDGAIAQYFYSLNEGNPKLLASLYLGPMHQAGIPVYSHYKHEGRFVSLSVEEELLDRHKVSFIEAPRPSKTSELYASLPHGVSALIIRCHMMKNADNNPLQNVVASFVYYAKAIAPELDIDYLAWFLCEMVNNCESESDQSYLIKHLAAPLASMREINPSSFPSLAQMEERDIPDPDLDNVQIFPGTDSYARILLKMSATEILEPSEKGLLITYIIHNRNELDPEQAWIILKSARPAQKKMPPKKKGFSRTQRYIQESSSSEATLLKHNREKAQIEFLHRAEVIETQELFKGTFGESVFGKDIPIPVANLSPREQLKQLIEQEDWDEFSINLVDRLTDEEVDRWIALDPIRRGDEIEVFGCEVREELWGGGGGVL